MFRTFVNVVVNLKNVEAVSFGHLNIAFHLVNKESPVIAYYENKDEFDKDTSWIAFYFNK